MSNGFIVVGQNECLCLVNRSTLGQNRVVVSDERGDYCCSNHETRPLVVDIVIVEKSRYGGLCLYHTSSAKSRSSRVARGRRKRQARGVGRIESLRKASHNRR